MSSEQESSIYNKSLDILSYREHSRKELKNKLIKKFDNAQLVEKTLIKLEDNNLLNDIRFAEAYISMRKRKGFGPKKILFELKEKGIPDSVVRKIIEEEGGWAEAASKTFFKKFKGGISDDFKVNLKQKNFLQNKGFGFKEIEFVFGSDML